MDERIYKRNEVRAQRVMKGLESRNMTAYYAADGEEACRIAMGLIPDGGVVAMGGCESAVQIGLVDAVRNGNYTLIDRQAKDPRAAFLASYDADVYLASANGMTEDGIIVNIDGTSNRVSCIAHGPKKVVLIVGMNKVCSDLDHAIKRARNVAAPINAMRLNRDTPCSKTGTCMDCKSPDTICCQFLITRFSRQPGRIHVILVNEDLGF